MESGIFAKGLSALLLAFLMWRSWVYARANPQLFTKENMLKSLQTVAVVGLALTGFVVLMVLMLRA